MPAYKTGKCFITILITCLYSIRGCGDNSDLVNFVPVFSKFRHGLLNNHTELASRRLYVFAPMDAPVSEMRSHTKLSNRTVSLRSDLAHRY